MSEGSPQREGGEGVREEEEKGWGGEGGEEEGGEEEEKGWGEEGGEGEGGEGEGWEESMSSKA